MYKKLFIGMKEITDLRENVAPISLEEAEMLRKESFNSITDKDGKASITLQYGKYTIKQMTTTEGFEKIEPIELDIKDTKKEEFTLKDYKIPVPDTYKKLNIFELIWQKLKLLFF